MNEMKMLCEAAEKKTYLWLALGIVGWGLCATGLINVGVNLADAVWLKNIIRVAEEVAK